MIITIDGPAGVGKSTAARKLAEALAIAYLDTGATYRAVTLAGLRAGLDMSDEDGLVDLARKTQIEIKPTPNGASVLLAGKDVSADIRAPEVTNNTHYAASSKKVRSVLVELQRKMASQLGSCVTEGRDQGTVVFPNADVKFYLTASQEVRTQRRCEELKQAGQSVQYDKLFQELAKRDHRDRNRSVGPLAKPEGAIEVDTSDKTIEQTAEELLGYVEARR